MSVFSSAFKTLKTMMEATSEDPHEQVVDISSEEFRQIISQKTTELGIYDLAFHTAVTIIANALSKCEFRTFLWKEKEQKIEETFGTEYYLWNYEPNPNQNAKQFVFKLVWSLVYHGECLVVPINDRLYIADTYTHDKRVLGEDVFSDICIKRDDEPGNGSPFYVSGSRMSSDVMFYRLNNRNVRSILDELTTEYRDLLKTALTNYSKQGGERGILTIAGSASTAVYGKKPDGTNRTFNDVYNEIMNKQFATYFQSPNAVMTLWDGFKYEPKQPSRNQTASNLTDVTGITDEIYERVATAMQIPPALLKGDIADVEAVTENFITFGIDPIAKMIETENNRKRYGRRALNGSRMIVDTSRIKHADAFSIASSADKMIACGAWSIDDVRRKANDVPLGEEWSRRHFLTKNYASMTETEEAAKTAGKGNENESQKDQVPVR